MPESFLTDRSQWQEQWDSLSEVDRHEIVDAVLHGRPVDKPHLAPLVWRYSRRHRSQVIPMVLGLPVLMGGIAVLGSEDVAVALFAVVVTGVLAAAAVLWFEWQHEAAVRRNAAVLAGLDPVEAARVQPRRKILRLARWVGLWLLSFWIALGILRWGGMVLWAMLQTRGVRVAGDLAEQIGVVLAGGLALFLAWLLHRALLADDQSPPNARKR